MKTICIYHSRDLEIIKRCSTCDTFKIVSLFSNNRSTKDGKHNQCKECNKIQAAKYYIKNFDKIISSNKNAYQKDIDKSREYSKSQYQKHKNKKMLQNKKWREANSEKVKQIHKNWYSKNRDKKLKQNADWEKNKLITDPLFRVIKNLRTRIPNALNGKVKFKGTIELLGCSIQELKNHLEKQFDEYMNWNNYGSYWHVDHKKPVSLFDLSKESEQKECFHYTNLQPLEAIENLIKYNKFKKEDKYEDHMCISFP